MAMLFFRGVWCQMYVSPPSVERSVRWKMTYEFEVNLSYEFPGSEDVWTWTQYIFLRKNIQTYLGNAFSFCQICLPILPPTG